MKLNTSIYVRLKKMTSRLEHDEEDNMLVVKKGL